MRGHGREIHPYLAGRVSDEETVVKAPLVFLDQHPQLVWPRDVGILRVERDKVLCRGRNRPKARIARAHEAVHGITAQRWNYLPSNQDPLVGRAVVDSDADRKSG